MDFPAHPTSPGRRKLLLGLVAFLTLLGVGGGSIGALVMVAPATVRYHLRPDVLEVEASLGPFDLGRVVPRGGVRDARAVALGSGHRIAGTGRGDLCQGRWRFAELGEVWIATGCTRDAVLLDTEGGRVVIAPEDRDAFLRDLAGGATGTYEAPRGPSVGSGAIGLVALLPVLIAVPLLLLFVRVWTRSMTYRIDGGTLVVPAHLGPVRVALRGARIRRVRPSRFWRVAGSGLPGFYLGLFRLDGVNVHAAATRHEEGLVVEGGKRPVFVTPADAEAFLAKARSEGAGVEG